MLDLCSRKTRGGKSHDYCDVIVVEKLRFRDGLVWAVGLTVENKAALSNSSGEVRTGSKAKDYIVHFSCVPYYMKFSPPRHVCFVILGCTYFAIIKFSDFAKILSFESLYIRVFE